MKKRRQNEIQKFRYNEPKWKAPKHKYPKTETLDIYENSGIGARLIIEKALQSIEGINIHNLQQLNISPRDLVVYRDQIKDALFSLIKEDCNADLRLRSGAIAYLSVLKFYEAAELISQIAFNPHENIYVRKHAVESLKRLTGKASLPVFEKLAYDPIALVREQAVRSIGFVGNKKSVSKLEQIAKEDENPEVCYRANAAIEQIKTSEEPKRVSETKRNKDNLVIKDSDIIKPIGRHKQVKPQTTPDQAKKENKESNGGLNYVFNQEILQKEAEKPKKPIAYEILNRTSENNLRLVLRGKGIGDLLRKHPFAKVYRRQENEVVLEISDQCQPVLGSEFNLGCNSDNYQDLYWLPDAPSTPVIYSIKSKESTIWVKNEFSLKIDFHIPKSEKSAYLLLKTRFPKSNWKEFLFKVSPDEISKGEKVIGGFLAAISGNIEVQAKLYIENGSASKFSTRLMALPSNPISLNVYPSTTGTIGEGPAHYNASENRFYCYANLQISNGFPHDVTIGPHVSARVTDGGNEKDNFSFNISTSTVPANSTRTIGVYMYFGGKTFKVFKNFGDVTIRLTLQTTEGNIRDSHVWAAMAQVKLALNFVGNFSSTRRADFQNVVDNETSAIFEQQNLYISDSERFLLPSNHPDFNRYRDIELEDNKADDCTAGSNEADELRATWKSPNDDWLDVWVVESFSGPACAGSIGGFSPVNGPTSKSRKKSGVIINLSDIALSFYVGRNLLAVTIAHEVGHFLGLGPKHSSDNSNFMFYTTDGNNTNIKHDQYLTMVDHDFVSRFVV